jgi:hypothetical protein
MPKYCLGIVLFLLLSCQGHKPPKGLIPEKDMEKILTEIHIADALTQSSEFRRQSGYMDSLTYSKSILSKYGYTIAQFDSTVAWYAGYPDDYDKMYEQVINRLSREEGSLNALTEDSLKNRLGKNLWTGKDNWKLPEDGPQSKIYFNIPYHGPGIYTISASIRLYYDDQSTEPQMTAWYLHKLKGGTGIQSFLPHKAIQKSNTFLDYSICDTVKEGNYSDLTGYILDHQEKDGNWRKHAEVKNIVIRFTKLHASRKSVESIKSEEVQLFHRCVNDL